MQVVSLKLMKQRNGVLMITSGLGPGGTERCVSNYALMAQKEGLRWQVLTEGRGEPYYHEKLKRSGIRVTVADAPPYSLKFNRQLKALIIEESIAHVVDFRGDFGAVSLATSRHSGAETAVAMYRNAASLYRPTLFNRAAGFILRCLVYASANCIASNSQSVLNAFFPKMLQTKKFKVVPNGVDLHKFPAPTPLQRRVSREALGVADGTLLLANVARLSHQKNQIILIDLVNRLRKHLPIKLAIAGEGPLRHKLMSEARRSGADKDILFLGHVDNIQPLLAATDVFLFPSLYEGMPNALLEAMLLGVPIVSSRIPEIEEIVPYELLGNLVPPLDSEALYVTSRRVIENIHLQKLQSEQLAHRLRERWDLNICFKRLLRELNIEDNQRSDVT